MRRRGERACRDAREQIPSVGPIVQPRGSRVSPANHRGGGWDFEPVTASLSVGRSASEPCGSDCGWRRVARVAGSRLQPYRMETCDTEEPDEGKLHVRICGEAGGASPRLYPDSRATPNETRPRFPVSWLSRAVQALPGWSATTARLWRATLRRGPASDRAEPVCCPGPRLAAHTAPAGWF